MKPLLLILTFLTFTYTSFSQTRSVNELVTIQLFSNYTLKTPYKRPFLNLKEKKLVTRLNPLYYIGATFLYLYQNVVSEQIQADCNYEISCSEYTKLSIERKGFIMGILAGADQLSNCTPNSSKDYPSHKLKSNNKIINSFEE